MAFATTLRSTCSSREASPRTGGSEGAMVLTNCTPSKSRTESSAQSLRASAERSTAVSASHSSPPHTHALLPRTPLQTDA
eukprot:1441819-Rhodomonas_salina.2